MIRMKLLHRPTLSLAVIALMAGLLFWGRLLMQDVPRTAIAEPQQHLAIHTTPPSEAQYPALKPLPTPTRDLFRMETASDPAR